MMLRMLGTASLLLLLCLLPQCKPKDPTPPIPKVEAPAPTPAMSGAWPRGLSVTGTSSSG